MPGGLSWRALEHGGDFAGAIRSRLRKDGQQVDNAGPFSKRTALGVRDGAGRVGAMVYL